MRIVVLTEREFIHLNYFNKLVIYMHLSSYIEIDMVVKIMYLYNYDTHSSFSLPAARVSSICIIDDINGLKMQKVCLRVLNEAEKLDVI